MRGASALQVTLSAVNKTPIRAFIVWEPVIRTDISPPVSQVLALVPDPRASQYWDPSRLLSTAIRQSEGNGSTAVVWDWVAVFPPGARWEEVLPKPAFADGPVVHVIGRLQEQLQAVTATRETGS